MCQSIVCNERKKFKLFLNTFAKIKIIWNKYEK